eukprot:gene56383-66973_t
MLDVDWSVYGMPTHLFRLPGTTKQYPTARGKWVSDPLSLLRVLDREPHCAAPFPLPGINLLARFPSAYTNTADLGRMPFAHLFPEEAPMLSHGVYATNAQLRAAVVSGARPGADVEFTLDFSLRKGKSCPQVRDLRVAGAPSREPPLRVRGARVPVVVQRR